MFGLSNGDTIALVAMLVLASGMLVREIRATTTDAARKAAAEAGARAVAEGLAGAIAQIANAHAKLADLFRDHELECASFKSRIEEGQRLQAKASADQARALEHIRAQISRLGPHGDRFVQLIPGAATEDDPPSRTRARAPRQA